MDKVAKLKSVALGLGAGGILGAGGGIAAYKQIQNNKNNARSVKGWDTRRRNSHTKVAEQDSISDVKSAIRTLGTSLDNPSKAAKIYATKSLIHKVRNLLKSPTLGTANGGHHHDGHIPRY